MAKARARRARGVGAPASTHGAGQSDLGGEELQVDLAQLERAAEVGRARKEMTHLFERGGGGEGRWRCEEVRGGERRREEVGCEDRERRMEAAL